MFGKKIKNGYRPPTDPIELEKTVEEIRLKRSTLSYMERKMCMIAYFSLVQAAEEANKVKKKE